MSDDRPKSAPAPAPPATPSGPPKLERVPAGYRPPAVRPAPDATRPPAPSSPSPSPPSPPAAAGGEGSGEGARSATHAAAAPPRAPGASHGLAAREVGADAALAAGLAHEGSLASEGALRLFALAAALQATGRLTLSAEGKAYALTFRRGAVVHAASSVPGEDLGRFLVGKGALTEAQRVQAESARARAGGDLAAALVAERLVGPADVAALLQEHGAAVFQRALAVEAGGWAWAPGAVPPPSAFPLGAPLAMLCAVVRALDAPALLRRLGDRERRAASRVGARIRLEDLRLTPQETRAAQLFDGVRSPAEIAAASPGDALVVLRLALLLGEVDLLAFGAPRASAAPPAAGPAPHGPPASPAARPTPRPGQAEPRGGGSRAGGPGAPAPSPVAAPQARPPVAPPPQPPRPVANPVPVQAAPAPLEPAALEALLERLRDADHFEVLGLGRGASGAQIKAAYFQLAKTYHPDAVPAGAPAEVRKLCADVFAKLSEAWSVLGEDGSRAQYVALLQAGGPASLDVQAIFRAENAFQAGTMLVKARRYDEALRRFDEAIGLNPDEAEFSMWKDWCEFLLSSDKKGSLGASGGAVEAALKRNPRCAQGYLFLGQMAKIAGDLALAERQLRRGLAVAPDHAELQRELKYLRK